MPAGIPGGVILDALGNPIVNCENGGVKIHEPAAGPCCAMPCEHCQEGTAPPRWLATFSGIQVCDSCIPVFWGDNDPAEDTGRTFAWSILSGTVNGSFLLSPVDYEPIDSCDWDSQRDMEARCDRWNREYVYYSPDNKGWVCTDIYRTDTYYGCYIKLRVHSVLVVVTMDIAGAAGRSGYRLFSSEDWLSTPLDCTQPFTTANLLQTCVCIPSVSECTEPGSGGSLTLTPYYA